MANFNVFLRQLFSKGFHRCSLFIRMAPKRIMWNKDKCYRGKWYIGYNIGQRYLERSRNEWRTWTQWWMPLTTDLNECIVLFSFLNFIFSVDDIYTFSKIGVKSFNTKEYTCKIIMNGIGCWNCTQNNRTGFFAVLERRSCFQLLRYGLRINPRQG